MWILLFPVLLLELACTENHVDCTTRGTQFIFRYKHYLFGDDLEQIKRLLARICALIESSDIIIVPTYFSVTFLNIVMISLSFTSFWTYWNSNMFTMWVKMDVCNGKPPCLISSNWMLTGSGDFLCLICIIACLNS